MESWVSLGGKEGHINIQISIEPGSNLVVGKQRSYNCATRGFEFSFIPLFFFFSLHELSLFFMCNAPKNYF